MICYDILYHIILYIYILYINTVYHLPNLPIYWASLSNSGTSDWSLPNSLGDPSRRGLDPSGYLTVCYGKWWVYPMENGKMVGLPYGKWEKWWVYPMENGKMVGLPYGKWENGGFTLYGKWENGGFTLWKMGKWWVYPMENGKMVGLPYMENGKMVGLPYEKLENGGFTLWKMVYNGPFVDDVWKTVAFPELTKG